LQSPYQPKEYWEQRFSQKLDVSVVGHASLGRSYNEWLYRGRYRALHRALRRLKLTARGESLLDVGVGSGAYIRFWQRAGVAGIAGLDITAASVNLLSSSYPALEFRQADICAPDLAIDREWDIVTAFDVLFHVTDDDGFSAAIANLAKLTKPGGWVILSDGFCDNPLGPFYHEYHRTRDHYVRELSRAGLRTVHFEPIFFAMSTTMCDPDGRHRHLAWLTGKMLGLVGRLAARRWLSWANYVIGCGLYVVDGVLGRAYRTGPSLKFLFAQRSS
jgi:SAM-dependent methyltransferase